MKTAAAETVANIPFTVWAADADDRRFIVAAYADESKAVRHALAVAALEMPVWIESNAAANRAMIVWEANC